MKDNGSYTTFFFANYYNKISNWDLTKLMLTIVSQCKDRQSHTKTLSSTKLRALVWWNVNSHFIIREPCNLTQQSLFMFLHFDFSPAGISLHQCVQWLSINIFHVSWQTTKAPVYYDTFTTILCITTPIKHDRQYIKHIPDKAWVLARFSRFPILLLKHQP